jgi:aminoglycoside phosphotransferase family enzyme
LMDKNFELHSPIRLLLSDLCRRDGGTLEIRETHMSWLFLGARRVYKLKKPVRYPFLDFSSVAKRRYYCFEELRLNRRLASNAYLSVLPICRTADDGIHLGDHGEVVDWVVEMRRLSDHDMLDSRMRARLLEAPDIEAVASLLSRFYRSLLPERIDANHQLAYLSEQLDIDAVVLCRKEFELAVQLSPLLNKTHRLFQECAPELRERIASGWFREGHGDLRPEHVWLGTPLQIIDCLEFNRMMRIVDPYEEVAQLGLECSIAGYPWVSDLLETGIATLLGGQPTDELAGFYTISKALLRARLCMAHFLDPTPRNPWKWRPLALKYIKVASDRFKTAG